MSKPAKFIQIAVGVEGDTGDGGMLRSDVFALDETGAVWTYFWPRGDRETGVWERLDTARRRRSHE